MNLDNLLIAAAIAAIAALAIYDLHAESLTCKRHGGVLVRAASGISYECVRGQP